MTTTDTEAKALALELLNTVRDSRGLPTATMEDAHGFAWFDALCRAIERLEATEARHAAELRELKERFSEAVERVLTVTDRRQETHAWRTLSPFILPAPDPLVEALASLPVGFAGCVDGADALRAAMQARGYEWRKIGEAGK